MKISNERAQIHNIVLPPEKLRDYACIYIAEYEAHMQTVYGRIVNYEEYIDS
jgi:hypothetical protein